MLIKRTALLLAGLFILHLAPGCNNYDLLQQLENPGSVKSTCGSDCRIFMTSNTFSGSMGGVYGADNFCRFDPANPSGSGRGNWKAMVTSNIPVRRACLSAGCATDGAAENIDWVLRPNTPYKRPDGTPIGTTSANGIFQTTLTNSIGLFGVGVWTGLTMDWENNSLNCDNWKDGTSGPEASIGTATGVINDAIASGTSFCNQGNHLYCVEQ